MNLVHITTVCVARLQRSPRGCSPSRPQFLVCADSTSQIKHKKNNDHGYDDDDDGDNDIDDCDYDDYNAEDDGGVYSDADYEDADDDNSELAAAYMKATMAHRRMFYTCSYCQRKLADPHYMQASN